MTLKNLFRGIAGKKEIPSQPSIGISTTVNELFPVIHASDVDLTRYQKQPLADFSLLGAAFSQLPQSARTITATTSMTATPTEPLFRQINIKNVVGYTRDNGMGTTGNIIATNTQGKEVIVGRMRYKQVSDVSMSSATTSVIPFDPMTLAVAAALMTITQQLDTLQKTAEDILQFLQAEKQSRKRGNLSLLAEMMENYRQEGASEKLFGRYISSVMEIKREAFQDIDFYQNRVNSALQRQKAIHSTGNVHALLGNIMAEFREYQLACYLYGYSTLMETLLTDEFRIDALHLTAAHMSTCADRYQALYNQCHEQLGAYQRSALQNRLMSGLGSLTRSMGEKLSAVPILNKGPVDEAMIAAGGHLAQRSHDNTSDLLAQFEPLQACHLAPFINSIRAIETMAIHDNGLLTDGENLYSLIST